MTTTPDARSALGDLLLRARTLALHLEVAESLQWSPAPRRVTGREPSERARGRRPSDPTADVALDETRLVLRAAVRESEAALAAATDRLSRTAGLLEQALEQWHGDATAATPENHPFSRV